MRRCSVEPLCVVDQAYERQFLSRQGERPERREVDDEAIRRHPGTEAERRAQRIALRASQLHERTLVPEAGARLAETLFDD